MNARDLRRFFMLSEEAKENITELSELYSEFKRNSMIIIGRSMERGEEMSKLVSSCVNPVEESKRKLINNKVHQNFIPRDGSKLSSRTKKHKIRDYPSYKNILFKGKKSRDATKQE